jgi:hypothetical protein
MLVVRNYTAAEGKDAPPKIELTYIQRVGSTSIRDSLCRCRSAKITSMPTAPAHLRWFSLIARAVLPVSPRGDAVSRTTFGS